MEMIAAALTLIVESESFSRVYTDIKHGIEQEIGTEDNGFATNSWLAGLLASRGSSEGKLARAVGALEAGQLDPESKEYRDAVRTKVAFEVLYRYGMVNRAGNGRYAFPSSSPKDAAKRARLSKFRDFMSSGFNDDKIVADTKKNFREVKDQVAQEWAASLPPEKKKMLDAYSALTASAFTMLQSLFHVRGPADVAAFRARVNNAKFSEATDLTILKKLGFVGENSLMNRGLVKEFGAFLRDPDGTGAPNAFARLMPFNSELTYHIKRSTADKALARNAAGKDKLDPEAPQTKDEMSDEQERAINSRIPDRIGGSKESSRNERARDQKNNFAGMVDQAFA